MMRRRLAVILLAVLAALGVAGPAYASDHAGRGNGSGDKHQCEGDDACRGRTGDGSFSPTVIIYPPAEGLPGVGQAQPESLFPPSPQAVIDGIKLVFTQSIEFAKNMANLITDFITGIFTFVV